MKIILCPNIPINAPAMFVHDLTMCPWCSRATGRWIACRGKEFITTKLDPPPSDSMRVESEVGDRSVEWPPPAAERLAE